jgi:hypothetical protein
MPRRVGMMAVDPVSPASVVARFGKLYRVAKKNGGTFREFFQGVIAAQLPSIVEGTMTISEMTRNLNQAILMSPPLQAVVTDYYNHADTAFRFLAKISNGNLILAINRQILNGNAIGFDRTCARNAKSTAIDLSRVLYEDSIGAPPGLVTRWDWD